MHIRLVFTLTLFFASFFGGYGLLTAGGYCTVEDIEKLYLSGQSLDGVTKRCVDLNVQCSTTDVFLMIDEGFSVPDIYYECG